MASEPWRACMHGFRAGRKFWDHRGAHGEASERCATLVLATLGDSGDASAAEYAGRDTMGLDAAGTPALAGATPETSVERHMRDLFTLCRGPNLRLRALRARKINRGMLAIMDYEEGRDPASRDLTTAAVNQNLRQLRVYLHNLSWVTVEWPRRAYNAADLRRLVAESVGLPPEASRWFRIIMRRIQNPMNYLERDIAAGGANPNGGGPGGGGGAGSADAALAAAAAGDAQRGARETVELGALLARGTLRKKPGGFALSHAWATRLVVLYETCSAGEARGAGCGRMLAYFKPAGVDADGAMTFKASPQRVIDLATVTAVRLCGPGAAIAAGGGSPKSPKAKAGGGLFSPRRGKGASVPDGCFEVVTPSRTFFFAPDAEVPGGGGGGGGAVDWRETLADAARDARDGATRRLPGGRGRGHRGSAIGLARRGSSGLRRSGKALPVPLLDVDGVITEASLAAAEANVVVNADGGGAGAGAVAAATMGGNDNERNANEGYIGVMNEEDFIVDAVRDMRVDIGRQTEVGANDTGCSPPRGAYGKVGFFFEKYHHLGRFDLESARRGATTAHFLFVQAYGDVQVGRYPTTVATALELAGPQAVAVLGAWTPEKAQLLGTSVVDPAKRNKDSGAAKRARLLSSGSSVADDDSMFDDDESDGDDGSEDGSEDGDASIGGGGGDAAAAAAAAERPGNAGARALASPASLAATMGARRAGGAALEKIRSQLDRSNTRHEIPVLAFVPRGLYGVPVPDDLRRRENAAAGGGTGGGAAVLCDAAWWRSAVVGRWRAASAVHLSAVAAERAYVERCMRMPCYGQIMFDVSVEAAPAGLALPRAAVLACGPSRFCRAFSHIRVWAQTSQTLNSADQISAPVN